MSFVILVYQWVCHCNFRNNYSFRKITHIKIKEPVVIRDMILAGGKRLGSTYGIH